MASTLAIDAPGGPVAASWFASAQAARGVVVVAPALATPRRFYAPFCEYLNEHGFDALVFDYRGIESGRAHEAKASRTDMETWARVDLSTAIDEAVQRAEGKPVHLIGHSLGGMALGAIDDLHARYVNAPVQRAHLSPADVGLGCVGHFGFFKRGSEGLWMRALPWLSNGRNAFAAGA